MPHRKNARERRTPVSETELDAAAARLDRLAADKNLIAGIHNYCDRWCERCPQTARCLSFKMEQGLTARRGGRKPAHDRENQEFWDELTEAFALTMHLVRREAKKLGLDLESPQVMAAAGTEERSRRRRAAREGSGLHRAATAYWKSGKELLDRLPDELRATEEALNIQLRLGAGDPRGTGAEIRDAIEVVQWYLYFIDAKLSRAVAGRVDDAIEGDDGFPSDADGSAKAALIAIDRSMAAWARLREHLDGEADGMLDLLVQLERLRRAAEREFPRARAFKRPGFD